jgi:hypothetical protein
MWIVRAITCMHVASLANLAPSVSKLACALHGVSIYRYTGWLQVAPSARQSSWSIHRISVFFFF